MGGGQDAKAEQPDKKLELLQEEVHSAYKLVAELEEENRRLQHEVLKQMKDLMVEIVKMKKE